jgi:hypothetical protein
MAVERRIQEASVLRDFFQEQWQYLLELLGVDDELPEEELDGIPVAEAISEIVQGTDARIRAVSNYKDSLRAGTRSLLQHIDGIVERVPTAVKLTKKSFVYNHQISSLLESMKEVRKLCAESDEIQEYLKSPIAVEQGSFFAVLFMDHHEKVVFGDALKGDIIQRDVKQTSVYFTGHKLLAPAATEKEVRLALKYILFDNVVNYLKQFLTREKRSEIKGSEDFSYFSNSMESLNNPSKYLHKLVRILELPLQLISMHDDTVCINSMGIKQPGPGRPCDEVHLHELEIGDDDDNILALVEIDIDDIS